MANDYKNVISSKKAEANKLMTDDQVVKCNVAIHTASAAAGAEAFIPIPGVDAVPITATQITMIIALGKIFDQKISESAAKAVIGAAASTFVGRSLIKLIPVAGWVASTAVAAGVTEAIGWTAAVDFANQASKLKQFDHIISAEDITDEEDTYESSNFNANEDVDGEKEHCDDTSGTKDSTDSFEEREQSETTIDSTETVNDDDPDDESISKEFSKMFGEED